MGKDFFVVDLEFTQYTRPIGRPRTFFSEIIEIGAVRISGDTKQTTGKIQNFVKPHFFPKQAAESMVFCMITEADMKTAIEFGDMLLAIGSLYVPGETYFVSWGEADYGVIEQGCARHALPNPILPEDCLDLAAAYKLLKGGRNTTGLRRATEELEIDAEGLWHTAYDDANNTGKVLLKLMEEGWLPEHYFSDIK
ncbi:MAG: exonuclease domain-containing protein [Oscillospiraceae bacterium]|nr:exonuclease domain-containing protein [Oscillospiraceae bacterium]